MRRELMVVAGVVVVIMVIQASSSIFLIFEADDHIPDGGMVLGHIDMDVQGEVSHHSPQVTTSLPTTIRFHAHPGDNGHAAWGKFATHGTFNDITHMGMEVTLKDVHYEKDGWMNRIGIATQWYSHSEGKYYYLEYDIWDSPITCKKVPNINVLNFDFRSDMPTVNVKLTQMEPGDTRAFLIPIQHYFDLVWHWVDAELTGVYLVVEKTSVDSRLFAELTIHDFRLYTEAET